MLKYLFSSFFSFHIFGGKFEIITFCSILQYSTYSSVMQHAVLNIIVKLEMGQMDSFLTTGLLHVFQVKLAEFSKTPEDFLRKYEELKSKNVRNLDPLVYLLSKLCEDKEVKKKLHNI